MDLNWESYSPKNKGGEELSRTQKKKKTIKHNKAHSQFFVCCFIATRVPKMICKIEGGVSIAFKII